MRNMVGRLAVIAAATGLLCVALHRTDAAVQVTDTVGTSGKFLVTGMPVSGPASDFIKIVLGNLTSGTNLELCAESTADFSSGTCGLSLSSSGGPGFSFLTIVDLAQLNGKVLFVKPAVGTTASKFSLTVE